MLVYLAERAAVVVLIVRILYLIFVQKKKETLEDGNDGSKRSRQDSTRFKIKKIVNLIICAVIAALGISSFVFIWNYDGDGLLTFRWMTVDGTVFSTAIAIIYCVASILEMTKYTEITFNFVYYLRLASAVAEGLIIVVVLLSQLPFSPQHMHILRYDMFNMHIVIPVLTIASFITNDSPIGKLKARKLTPTQLFVTLYCGEVILLIVTKLSAEMIPSAFRTCSICPCLRSYYRYCSFTDSAFCSRSFFIGSTKSFPGFGSKI